MDKWTKKKKDCFFLQTEDQENLHFCKHLVLQFIKQLKEGKTKYSSDLFYTIFNSKSKQNIG
jgi:hypothetical protein